MLEKLAEAWLKRGWLPINDLTTDALPPHLQFQMVNNDGLLVQYMGPGDHPALLVAMLDELVGDGFHDQSFNVEWDEDGGSYYSFATDRLDSTAHHTCRTKAVMEVFIKATLGEDSLADSAPEPQGEAS